MFIMDELPAERRAFLRALEAYNKWKSDEEPEPKVEMTISEACALVLNCHDMMPKGFLGIDDPDETYAAVAKDLLERIEFERSL